MAPYRQRFDDMWVSLQDTLTVFCAVDEGIFAHLATPATVEEVAQAHGWDGRAARLFLEALLGLGLVVKQGEMYQNSDITQACLVTRSPEDQTAIIQHRYNCLPQWLGLGEALRLGGRSPQEADSARNPEEVRAFICGMESVARTSAAQLWGQITLEGRSNLLDIGGGPGTYALEALRRYPDLRATVLDLEDVITIAREQAGKAGLDARMEYIPADMTQGPLPRGYDVHLMSNVIHMLGAGQVRSLIGESAQALEPGGLLLVKDFILDDDRKGPAFALRFALHMLVQTKSGQCYTVGELAEWMSDAGLEPVELAELTPQTRVWIAKKPG